MGTMASTASAAWCSGQLVNPEVGVKAVTDPFMKLKYMLYQLECDSVRKRFGGSIAPEESDGNEVEVKAVADPFMNLKHRLYQIECDSMHKRCVGTIATEVFHEKDPGNKIWGTSGTEYVCKPTGVHTQKEKAQLHLGGSGKKVIISSLPKVAVPIYVVGVNLKNHESSDTVLAMTATQLTVDLACLLEKGAKCEEIVAASHPPSSLCEPASP